MHSIGDQLAALERIAEFSAKVRGHEVGEWRAGTGVARASCIRCGSKLQVYCSLFEPDMDGDALGYLCGDGAVERAA